MSWRAAKVEADKIYHGLARDHPGGFIRMILRALERKLNREEKLKAEKLKAETEPFQDGKN